MERQLSPTLEGIRGDHLKRYQFAAMKIKKGLVLDAACGCGYGSWILSQAGMEVIGVDIAEEAINYATEHYRGPTYIRGSIQESYGPCDAVVSFETLEHLLYPLDALSNFEAPVLWASVPNENRYPFKAENFANDKFPHVRHYRPEEFEDLLNAGGWKVTERYCQKDKVGEIHKGSDGMFLLYGCRQI